MNIIVCVNHVPDSAAKIAIASDGKQIEKTGVSFGISPYDEYALEMGLRLKEKHSGAVTALSLGGDANKESLRKALAMGADKAVLLKDESARDSFATAKALADYIREAGAELVLCGRQSIDYDDSAVGGMIAELLGWASVSVAVSVEAADGSITAEREIEGGREIVSASLPAVVTAQKGSFEPRYPSLKGIMAAKSKPIEERPAAEAPARSVSVGLRKPAAKQPGRIVGNGAEAAAELVRLLREEAKVI